ncbi:MAG: DUF4097 family beta strand repeat-containing protein [Psychrosphaera sp.]|nr:DUF4097 family beta strand repeat-containing protein [Psychrosphaera sp.]
MLRLFTFLLVLTSPFIWANTNETPEPSQEQRTVKLEHYKWYGEAPKAKLVRVINPYGAISSRNTSYDNIEISGVIQKIGKSPAQHNIDIRDNNGVTEVVVSYPKGNKNAQGQLSGRFDLGVWVPSWVNVEMITDFGDIKVKKHTSNITAKTISGKIKIGTTGLVQAQSDSGDITVDLFGDRFKKSMRVSSNKGDVKVSLVQTARVTVQAQSNQPIKHNLQAYQAIKVTELPGHAFKAQLAKADQTATDLQLSSMQGLLTVTIAKKAAYKAKLGGRVPTTASKPQKASD